MIKIAHFIDTNVLGGAEALVEILIKNAIARGEEPVLLHFDHDSLVERLDKLGVQNIRLDQKRAYKSPKKILAFARYFRKLLQRERIDVLHSHLFGPIVAGAVATVASPITHVGTLHDSYILEEKPSRVHILRIASALGTHIVAVSESIRDYVISQSSGTRVHVVLNGTPERVECESNTVKQLRQSLAISADEIVCICIARIAPVKNHELLLRSWEKIEQPRPRLLIVGDGPLLQEVKVTAKKIGICDSVNFLGYRDDISELLNISDMFVLASHSEGLSCSIMEALTHGLPVIATDVGGNKELIKNSVTGLLVPPNSANDFAVAVSKLASDAAMRAQFSQAALESANERFSVRRMAEKYLTLYRLR